MSTAAVRAAGSQSMAPDGAAATVPSGWPDNRPRTPTPAPAALRRRMSTWSRPWTRSTRWASPAGRSSCAPQTTERWGRARWWPRFGVLEGERARVDCQVLGFRESVMRPAQPSARRSSSGQWRWVRLPGKARCCARESTARASPPEATPKASCHPEAPLQPILPHPSRLLCPRRPRQQERRRRRPPLFANSNASRPRTPRARGR
jgi:hypothetical protein